MRKSLLIVLILLLAGCCALAAAETEINLANCSGSMAVNENDYILLTPANLADHPELVSFLGSTQEALTADWEARGVQLQAWTKKMDACLEVSVIQDEEALQYFDLEQQTRQIRGQYLNAHKGTNRFTALGYTFTGLEWKKQKLGGNFLKYEYKRVVDGHTSRGIARKTVRNGWTVLLDYQVYDGTIEGTRLPRGTDENNLNKIANTVEFEVVEPASVDAVPSSSATSAGDGTATAETPVVNAGAALLQVTAAPPAETNEPEFTVEGHATPGATVIGVAMRWSSSLPLKFTTEVTRAGNFKLKVNLPEEGVWLLTLNLELNGKIVAEEVFNTTTYSKTLIPIVLDAEIPDELTSDELVISGTTSKGVTIQCIVSNGTTTFDKTIKTNATGKFRFKVPTAIEGEYDITLAFSKKNFNSNRVTKTARRNMTVQDKQNQAAAAAIHPSYSILSRKLDTYIGQTMVYTVWIADISQQDDEWIIQAALRSSKSGYSDFLYFMSGEDPGLEVDSKVKLYGRCVGAYLVQSEEETVSYPGFDYLFKEE